MTLDPRHYAMLHDASAISDTVIRQRGYQSLTRPDDLRDLGFSKTQARMAPALAIPLWDVHGQQTGWQIRPDSPRQFKDGTVAKYETPKGGRVSLDVHPGVQEVLGNPSIPLWITEGVRKGDSLASHGACCIAFTGGVWGFRGSNEFGGKVILPAWESVALNGRLVYVAYDSDIATKPGVKAALDALWRFLRDRQAIPARVHWPEEFQQRKWGVDDFLAAGHSFEEVLAMVPPIGPLPTTYHPRHNGTAPATPAVAEPALPWSDYTNALAFVREHGANVRYCYPWKSWLVWTGTYWQRDESGTVMQDAKQTIKRLARHAEDLHDLAEVKTLLAHIKASLATTKLKALVESAQSEPGIPVLPEALDADRWRLNAANGTLDLHTGTCRPHNRSDLLTKCLSVAYEPDASCPTWERFLWRIMGGTHAAEDTDAMSTGELEAQHTADQRTRRLITFLQRAIGYSLTGETREQCLFVLHGSGSNGKSTFLDVLQALLCDYAQSTPSATLLARDPHRHEGIPNDIARLRGARLVTAVEIGEGKRLNEELMKRLTGGDPMTARFLHAEFFDFKPEFKLFIACNHLPTIKGTDHAMWRRIKRIPFTVTIPDEEQDKDLPAQLKAELPGILAWAVRGCLDWQREGLAIPEEVIAATKDYRDSMDVIGRFIEECCIVSPQVRVKASDIYDAYKKWCEASGEHPTTLTTFGNHLEDQGFTRHKIGTIWRLGVGLPSSNG